MKVRLLILSLLTMVSACTTTGVREYQAFAEELSDPVAVSYLHVPANIMIDSIDGRGRYYPLLEMLGNPYRGARIALLPGRHEAQVIYHSQGWFTSDKQAVSFAIEGGTEYQIRAIFTTVDNLRQVRFEVLAQP